jgi:hypothetical protein
MTLNFTPMPGNPLPLGTVQCLAAAGSTARGSNGGRRKNIMLLEVDPIAVAVEIWGHELKNRRLVLFTDNQTLVVVLQKQTSKDSLTMFLIRRLVMTCLTNNNKKTFTNNYSLTCISGRGNNGQAVFVST